MKFDYIKFTEEWATLYKPMHHIPGEDSMNKRFHICDSYMTMTEFLQGSMDPECTPCVITESQQEGSIQGGMDYPRYTFYFLVRSGETHNGHSAVRAKKDAKAIMIDFLNFIRMFKYADEYEDDLKAMPLPEDSYLYSLRAAVMDGDPNMSNLNIEDVVYESLNELYDTWYGVTFTLDDVNVFNMCVDLSQYV